MKEAVDDVFEVNILTLEGISLQLRLFTEVYSDVSKAFGYCLFAAHLLNQTSAHFQHELGCLAFLCSDR